MKLNKLETQILIDIYDADINFKNVVRITEYELTEVDPSERRQEFAAYLFKLRRLKLIKFDEDVAFFSCGWRSRKYNTNVVTFWGEYIHITNKGIEFAEKIRNSVNEKGRGIAKRIGFKLHNEINNLEQ